MEVLEARRELRRVARAARGRLRLRRLLQVVLDRLHVVVRRPLDRLDLGGLADVKIGDDRLEQRTRRHVELGQLRHHRLVGESEQPLDLDKHTLFNETELREMDAESGRLVGVASVNRRDVGECVRH